MRQIWCPSIDKPDEPSLSIVRQSSNGPTLRLQSALVIPAATIAKIASAKIFAKKAAFLKETIGQIDYCLQTAGPWIQNFESAVRLVRPGTVEADIGTYFMAYLAYMLDAKHRSWFLNTRMEDESWANFKKKFFAHF